MCFSKNTDSKFPSTESTAPQGTGVESEFGLPGTWLFRVDDPEPDTVEQVDGTSHVMRNYSVFNQETDVKPYFPLGKVTTYAKCDSADSAKSLLRSDGDSYCMKEGRYQGNMCVLWAFKPLRPRWNQRREEGKGTTHDQPASREVWRPQRGKGIRQMIHMLQRAAQNRDIGVLCAGGRDMSLKFEHEPLPIPSSSVNS